MVVDSEEGDEQKNVKSTEWIFSGKTAMVINTISSVRGSVPGIQL